MALGSTQPLVKMSTRNIPGGKGGRCVRLTTSPPSRAEWHEIWESKPPETLWATPGLLRDSFNFYTTFNLQNIKEIIYALLTCIISTADIFGKNRIHLFAAVSVLLTGLARMTLYWQLLIVENCGRSKISKNASRSPTLPDIVNAYCLTSIGKRSKDNTLARRVGRIGSA